MRQAGFAACRPFKADTNMKKNIPPKTKPARYCRQCSHARLMRTSPHNPILAQCIAQPNPYYPMSPTRYIMHLASEPACQKFAMAQRQPELVASVR